MPRKNKSKSKINSHGQEPQAGSEQQTGSEQPQRQLSIDDAVHILCALADNPSSGHSMFAPTLCSILSEGCPELFKDLRQYANQPTGKRSKKRYLEYQGVTLIVPKDLSYGLDKDLSTHVPQTNAALYLLADDASQMYRRCLVQRKDMEAAYYVVLINSCLELAESWEKEAATRYNRKAPLLGRVPLDMALSGKSSNGTSN